MNVHRRNLVVGITILGSLVILAWFMLKFGKVVASPFAPDQMPIRLIADRADGLSDGSSVVFRGVESGRIVGVYRDKNHMTVIIDAMVDVDPPLPANLIGEVRTPVGIGGSAEVSLELTDPMPHGQLQRNAQLSAKFVGSSLLPPQFTKLAEELTKTAQDVQTIVGDPKVQSGLKESVENFRLTTTRAAAIADRVDRFSGKLDGIAKDGMAAIADFRASMGKFDTKVSAVAEQVYDRLDQTGKLLQTVHSIAAKIDNGVGTAGKVVNDPRLYQSLVESSQKLDETIKDLKRLIEQWEQEGASIKLR
jgi:phospholipid/cholesterol/gamma-HCH transport system substrate-binding protein